MKSCGTFWLACEKCPGSAESGAVIHTELTTLQSASVTPVGSTRVVAVNAHVAPAASGVGLVQSHCPTPDGAHAAPLNVVGFELKSFTLIGAGCSAAPMFLTLMSNLQSQSGLLGSDAQPFAVLVMLSTGRPAHAGFGIACAGVAESLPAGLGAEPGLGLTMVSVLFAEQTVGPPAYAV